MRLRPKHVAGRAFLGALAASGMIAFGCRNGGGAADEVDIIHGEPDTNANDATVLLVKMEEGRPASTCTGTLVAPNLVLTARHCVSETDRSSVCKSDGTALSGGAIGADSRPADLLVYTGTEAIVDLGNIAAAAARGKRLITETAAELCNKDVAFLLLNRNVDGPIAAIRTDGGPRPEEKLTAVGWGLTETGDSPRVRMKRDGVPITAIGPQVTGLGGAGIGSSEFLAGEVFCAGDSGGPAYSALGAVVGVVSRGGNGTSDPENRAAGCIGDRTRNTYTHLANKLELIAAAFKASGFEPLREGESRDAGSDAQAPAADAGPSVSPPDAGERNDASASDASSRDAGRSAASVAGKKNGSTCAQSEECISHACFEGYCRAQCTPGDCSFGWGCAARGGLHLCIEGASEQIADEEEPEFPKPPPPKKTETGASSSSCAATPSPLCASDFSALAVCAALFAFARRRQRP
jgi:hypothetical protein